MYSRVILCNTRGIRVVIIIIDYQLKYPSLLGVCFLLKSLRFSFSPSPLSPQVLVYRYVSGVWKIHVPCLVNIRRKMHEFASTSPLHPFRSRDWFFDMKSRQHLFPGDEKCICQVWSRSVGKCTILRQTYPFPHLRQGLVFRYEIRSVFISRGCKIHVPNLVQIRRKMHDFASNLLSSPFVLGVRFST